MVRRIHQASRPGNGLKRFSSNSRTPKPHKKDSILEAIAEVLSANPISMASAAMLVIGGALLIGLFVRHGYFPDADLASSTAILFAVASVGLMIGLLLAFVFVVPGVATRALADETKIDLNAACWAVIIVPTPVFLAFVMLGQDISWLDVGGSAAFLLALAASPVLLVALFSRKWVADLRAASMRRRECLKRKVTQALSLCLTSAVWLVASTLVLQFSLAVASEVERNPWAALLLALAWLVLVLGVNVAIVRVPQVKVWKFALIAGLGVLIVLLGITGNYSAISAAAFRMLGLGEVGPVSLAVTRSACDALNHSKHKGLLCTPVSDKEIGTIQNVRLLSRLGGQFLIEAGAQRGEQPGSTEEQRSGKSAEKGEGVPRAVLRKEDVVLWVFSDRLR